MKPGDQRRLARDLRPIPDPRLDVSAVGADATIDSLTAAPHGSTRSIRRFGSEEADATAPSASDRWFETDADAATARAGFGIPRLVAMFETSRPLRVTATIMLFFVVLALLVLFLKTFTSVLG